jgi:VIT1/CCC1 family predicted Fe2+/Mn2+ transporter
MATPLDAIERKKKTLEARARIREFVFGIQDGLMTTVGLLAGIQGATESKAVVIITGFAAMFSGAISMAAGSYLSSNAQRDIFDNELRDAEALAQREPYVAAEGLLHSLSQEGLSREQSYTIVKQLLRQQQVFLRTFQEKVFGIGSAELNEPLKAAIVMGLSFAIGALIPMIPYFLLRGWITFYLSVALSAVTLFGVGAFKGKLAGQSRWRSGAQFFLIAVGAAALGLGIGLIVQYFYPEIPLAA